MLELHHWEPNTVFLKPLIALAEQGTEFASRYFDAARFEQFAPEFPRNTESRLGLEHEGPVLVDGETIVSHSFFMLEYIAEAFPGAALHPNDAYERYRVRAWGQYLGQRLAPGVAALGCARYLAPELATRDPDAVRAQIAGIEPIERRRAWEAVVDGVSDAAALDEVRRGLEGPVARIEATLAEEPWLAGPDFTIADIDAYALLAALPNLAPTVVNPVETPRVSAFLERVRARAAVERALSFSRTGAPHTAFVPGPEPSRWG